MIFIWLTRSMSSVIVFSLVIAFAITWVQWVAIAVGAALVLALLALFLVFLFAVGQGAWEEIQRHRAR